MAHTVHIEPFDIDISAEDNASLAEIVNGLGIDFPCGGKGLCGNCHVELVKGTMEISAREKALLERKGLDSSRWRLACYGRITDDIVIRIPVREQVILSDNSSSRLSGEEGLAAAVDLGSTTIVVQLIDRKTGAVLESFSEINGQNGFGADIISRIAYALQGPEYSERLALTVREQVGRMTGDAVKASGRDDIRNVTIVGNSVMHHLFCKLDVTPLSAYPFQSPDNGRKEFTPSELGWSLPETCTVHFMPNISHFVGSDILAGILHTGIHRKDRWCALLDLGTNGEIVIGNKERILCTSTAAGPAFEGVNIVNGMRAVSGAVCRVDETSGKAEIIGNTRPSGICGSGLIDAIHYFRTAGRIDESGALVNPNDTLSLTPQVRLTEQDVREFQLAKAAIATGFQLLAAHIGIMPQDISHIYVAGGLGHYANISHALALGLLPDVGETQIVQAGNTALAGCKRFLATGETVRPQIEHLALETVPDFQDSYCAHLFFF